MHPWHDIELGERFPKVVTAVIEIPKSSNAKYRLDSKTGLLRLSEMLPTVTRYPANYGFFPRTVAGDGDALDVFVFGRMPLVPLVMLEVRLLGGMATMSPKKGPEEKLIAVCPGDPEFEQYKSLEDLPEFYVDELREFFREYKSQEGDRKKVKRIFGARHARNLLERSARDYAEKFNKGKLAA